MYHMEHIWGQSPTHGQGYSVARSETIQWRHPMAHSPTCSQGLMLACSQHIKTWSGRQLRFCYAIWGRQCSTEPGTRSGMMPGTQDSTQQGPQLSQSGTHWGTQWNRGKSGKQFGMQSGTQIVDSGISLKACGASYLPLNIFSSFLAMLDHVMIYHLIVPRILYKSFI